MAYLEDLAEEEIMLYMINYLIHLQYYDSAIVLMQESGVDPFWLCGESIEITRLRHWILSGQVHIVFQFLQPLRQCISDSEFCYALKIVEQQSRIEKTYKANMEATLGTMKSSQCKRMSQMSSLDSLNLFSDPVSTHKNFFTFNKRAKSMRNQVLQERIECYKKLLPYFRGELASTDKEFFYECLPQDHLRQIIARGIQRDHRAPASCDTSFRTCKAQSCNYGDHYQARNASLERITVCEARRNNPLIVSLAIDGQYDCVIIEADAVDIGTSEASTQVQQEFISSACQTKALPTSFSVLSQTEITQSSLACQTDLPLQSQCIPTQTDYPILVDKRVRTLSTEALDVIMSPPKPEQSPHESMKTSETVVFTCDAAPLQSITKKALSYEQLRIDHVVQAKVVAEVKEAHAVRALDISSARQEALIGTNGRTLCRFDLSSILPSSAIAHDSHILPLLPVLMEKYKHHSSPIYCVAYNHFAQDQWLASGSADGSIKLLHHQRNDAMLFRHSGKLRALHFSQSHLLCSASSGENIVRCWDIEHLTRGSCRHFDGHVSEIVCMQFPMHRQIPSQNFATASLDKTIRNWDFRTVRCTHRISTNGSIVNALAFCPKSDLTLASAHEDGLISIWDLRATHQPAITLSHHQEACRALSYSPDGNWLLSGSFDSTVCLFSTHNKLEPIASFCQHQDKVLQVQWIPHYPAFLTTGADHFVKLWTLSINNT